jgi:hypothetical protein
VHKKIICRHCGELFTSQPNKPGFINECPDCVQARYQEPAHKAQNAGKASTASYTFTLETSDGRGIAMNSQVAFSYNGVEPIGQVALVALGLQELFSVAQQDGETKECGRWDAGRKWRVPTPRNDRIPKLMNEAKQHRFAYILGVDVARHLPKAASNAEPERARSETSALGANRPRPDWAVLRMAGTERVDPQERNTDQETRLLVAALQSAFPVRLPRKFDSWAVPPLNVLDCVLSLNRLYDTFCLPRVQEFANRHPAVGTLTGLLELINAYTTPLDFSVTELDYRDEGRAETLVGVVKWLLAVQQRFSGASETSRLTQWAVSAKPYDYKMVGVRGFALSGFQYMRMLFGAQAAKPDIHIRRFVSAAIGHSVGDVQALTLLETACAQLKWPLADLDYSIWDRLARGSSQ